MVGFPTPTEVQSHQEASSTGTQNARPEGHRLCVICSSPCVSTPHVASKSKHSHHEEDAPGVRDTASSGRGGVPVIATRATHQAQVIKHHHEGQHTADNQATQPPGEASTLSLDIKEVDVLITQKLSC